MKKSFGRGLLYILVGALLGTVAGQLLSNNVTFFRSRVLLTWQPRVDLLFLAWSMNLQVYVNWMTFIGVLVAVYLLMKKK
ncbi:MAG: hypothetical protein OWQ59_10730 [Alicyclobacillaceae bacterium]|uniref:hypothetical protein n=1 Tax=Alicyclobacillus sp. SP_1 TaxID=2942475 RepID=UPI0021577788|nr:hypothetical protein [Alicyclobacillus sp. SP_1]MCY0888914.1 hypothetical protein [Alicyclobacillaceae bacterium]MCY0896332.1 hypothetical protein [Alicyclobacillaceae bacterium]